LVELRLSPGDRSRDGVWQTIVGGGIALGIWRLEPNRQRFLHCLGWSAD
jgi:hypothetical protein